MHSEAVKVLRMNSLAPDGQQNQEQPDLWTPCMSWSAKMLAKERLDMTRQGEASSSDSHGTNARRPGGLLSPEDLIGFQKFTASSGDHCGSTAGITNLFPNK